MTSCFTRILATGALATTLACGIAPSSQAMTLPVISVQEIAGAALAEPVYWRGYGWRGYGWGWRRPYYGYGWRGYGWGWRRPNYGAAFAAGAIAGGILGLAAVASTPYYGYPAYYGYYRPYRRVYYRPVYYRPVYYRRAYWRPAYYRPFYRRAYWW